MDLMRTIESALESHDPKENDVLKLVQQLNVHMQKLKFVQQETIAHADRVPGDERRRTELAKVIVGQQELIDQTLLTILWKNALLEGVPAIAKTLVIKSFARLFELEFRRVQCTSDLMPADIIGSNVLNFATSTFSLHRGPLFTDMLLADEVNRVPPHTQAALLEAMEERQITIDGIPHSLTQFFTVFATQNPIEFEGTYPLPEAQLDRFLLKIRWIIRCE